jgi:predicted small secreted protein
MGEEVRNWLVAAALGLAAIPFVAACDTNEGPLEEAGEEIDEAADDVEDAVN